MQLTLPDNSIARRAQQESSAKQMTLNITVLTRKTIYQSSDFRLTNIDTKQVITNASMKLVTLQYGEWEGFVSYTGIGRWKQRDTSEFILEWLSGLNRASFIDVVARIRDEGDRWLQEIELAWQRLRHTFVLAGFTSSQPELALISNFEDCYGRNDPQASAALMVSSWRFQSKPLVVLTGCKPAISRDQRRRLERFIQQGRDDPAGIRRRLADFNSRAATTAESMGMISPECAVASFRADGQGVFDVEGRVDIRSVTMGMPFPNKQELTKLLGFDPGSVQGMTFASSKPRVPFDSCKPRIVVPDETASYEICEIKPKDLVSCRALDVSNAGIVIGDGNPLGQPNYSFVWVSPVDGVPRLCGFLGKPGGINNVGGIVAEATMNDGFVHAVRWSDEALVDLGCFRGSDSGAVAINSNGLAAGWVCIDSENRGQINYRPAAWSFDKLYVLDSFGCEWGQAVDVNDADTVLVVGYIGMQCRALLWSPLAGTHEIVGGMAGIFPTTLTVDGTILGTSRDSEGKSVAWLANPRSRWEKLGTDAGFYATAMNNAGSVVGAAKVDGYEKPWLRRASGETIRLPYFDQHWCRPSAINDSGLIVGTAQTDHGTHALLWIPH
jgi:hypothetical protein